jgi:putative addiction module killer protein
MAHEVETTEEFDSWLDGLADSKAQEAIATRIVRVQSGLFGDHASVGDKVSELRIHYGPGYRVYYTLRGRVLVILLVGGSKRTQQKDIRRAKELAAGL